MSAMRRLDLTAEDMADLIAGHSINAMVEGGEEVIVAAPDGVNKTWSHEPPEPHDFPREVMRITVESYEEAGCCYTLHYPDGKKVKLGDAEDNYSELAGIIDDEYEKVAG